MKPEEAIEMLRGMQNKKVDYADLVCAPAFSYGHEYVYPEPEDYAIEEAVRALKEIQNYREIGTVEECRKAVEKQKPMKVNEVHVDEYYCPACGSENSFDQGKIGDRYCPYCGQAISLEESEE